jgi:PQQ-like domain
MKNPKKYSTNGTSRITAGLVALTVTLLLPGAMAVNVIMQGNNLSRTGANTSETILTPANVARSLGPLFTNGVDGQVYAQPLYVQNLSIAGGTHDVVFVCTESNSVYAFDADTAGVTYWHDQLGTPFTPSCSDLTPVVGITGTPVIDLSSGTLYVDTKLESGPSHELHALSITNGAEKFGGPATIIASGFDASIEHQRPGLLLLNGVVYLSFGSHCDQGAYHGFELGYNATNLSLLYTFNTTPSGGQGAIWSGGMAPAVDTNGNIYVMTGNGSFDGTANFSMSMIKLSPSLTVEDYATPTNWSSLSGADLDFGAGGPVLIPPNYAVGIGKDPTLYVVNINNMGHVGNFAQTLAAESNEGDTVGKSPVYWQGPTMQYLFLAHANNPTESFQFTGSSIDPKPLGTSSFTPNDRVGGLSLSANGNTNGVLWEIGSDSKLRAYDAVNISNVLWTGSVGSYVKMTSPTIANGKVYVGTSDGLNVYGLTNYLYSQTVVTNLVLNWANGILLQSTNLLGGWVTNSAGSPYTVLPTNTQMFYRLALP